MGYYPLYDTVFNIFVYLQGYWIIGENNYRYTCPFTSKAIDGIFVTPYISLTRFRSDFKGVQPSETYNIAQVFIFCTCPLLLTAKCQ